MSTLDDFISRSDWPAFCLVEDAGWLFDPDIVDGLPVWEWPSKNGVYTTRVRLEQHTKRVQWQIWRGGQLISEQSPYAVGVKATLDLINRWRRAGFDEKEVRRVEEMEDKAWEQADLYTDCTTCPNCGCPGME